MVIFFVEFQKGPPAANVQVPPAPPTTTIPTIPVAAASPRRDQSPSPKKPKSGSGSGMIRGCVWVSTLKDAAQNMKISKRVQNFSISMEVKRIGLILTSETQPQPTCRMLMLKHRLKQVALGPVGKKKIHEVHQRCYQ